ncbi:MAG: DNA-binding protein WhiA, partial [Clostridia bacterium]|nr:DNA-binding protein WhiA [Clostridia bacterium]
LQETAECRMQNPADSLNELAEKLGVSKSCLNHRLRKLMALHDKSYKR